MFNARKQTGKALVFERRLRENHPLGTVHLDAYSCKSLLQFLGKELMKKLTPDDKEKVDRRKATCLNIWFPLEGAKEEQSRFLRQPLMFGHIVSKKDREEVFYTIENDYHVLDKISKTDYMRKIGVRKSEEIWLTYNRTSTKTINFKPFKIPLESLDDKYNLQNKTENNLDFLKNHMHWYTAALEEGEGYIFDPTKNFHVGAAPKEALKN